MNANVYVDPPIYYVRDSDGEVIGSIFIPIDGKKEFVFSPTTSRSFLLTKEQLEKVYNILKSVNSISFYLYNIK